MLTDGQKAHFEAFGFAFLRQVFAADAVGEFIREAEAVWAQDRQGRRRDEGGHHMSEFVEKSPELTRLISDHGILKAAGDLLGPDFIWAGSEGNVTAKLAHGWHADRPSESESELAFTRLKANIYLDPVTRDSGALRVLPGSHRADFHRNLGPLIDIHYEVGSTDPLKTPYGVSGPDMPHFAFESEPGDLVFFNQSLYHAVFNGFPGRRYIALKFAARPTTEEHVRVMKETSGFPFRPHPAFAGSEIPDVRAMAGRLENAAV